MNRYAKQLQSACNECRRLGKHLNYRHWIASVQVAVDISGGDLSDATYRHLVTEWERRTEELEADY